MKVSIIIPTYNRASLLSEAIDSIVIHVRSDFEILVCDDGSTDSTPALCDEIAAKGIPICYLRSEQRLGAQAARNRGLRHATGDVLMFMDSDDVLAGPGIMQLLDALRRDSSLGYAYGKVVKTDEIMQALEPLHSEGSAFDDIPRELAGYHWHTMGAVYRRSYLDIVGPWNLDLTGSQDWEYQARVKLSGGRGAFIDVLVGWWRQHAGDRVGASEFRPDYVRSVMLACDSILSKARAMKRCDAELEQRIAKKLMLHALEWGTNGHKEMRTECLKMALKQLSSSSRLRALTCLAIHSPTLFDGLVWRWLTRRNI